jgi:glycosyltransferase involved in cell wall biosynthesis
LRNDGSLCPGQDDPWECTKCLMAGTKAYEGIQKILPEKMARSIFLGMGHFPWITNQPGFRGMMGNWQQRFAYQNEMLRKVDLVVTASKFLRDLYLKYQVLESRIIYSAYGLDMAWARGFTTKNDSRRLRIGFIGQVIPMKGVDLLLKAVQLMGMDSPIEVKIYGDLQKNPEYGKELVALKGNDERISFLGTFDNSKMGEVMMEIDVLVVPSSWYDFPLVVSSALATRTPVIATDLPGMNELIEHEKNGLLFARNDWKALAAQIKRLIDEKDLLLRLKEGIEPVKTVAEMSDEYQEIYARTAKRQDRSM